MKSKKSAVWVLLVVLASAGTGLGSLSDGLVGYWSFNNPTDPGHDDSGNGNNGAVVGAISTLGIVGSALRFDGINDYIRVADSDKLDLTSSFTLSFWINPGSSEESLLLAKHRAFTDMDGSWSLNRLAEAYPQYPGRLWMQNWLSPSGYEVHSETMIEQDTWVHWAITYDEPMTTCIFYINGHVDVIRDYTFNIQNTSLDLLIGAGEHFEVPVTYFYEGLMDEVRIYNRSLSADEIRALAVVPAPGAVVLAGVGVGVIRWLRRRRMF
jgi:hypothetical protein